ncbi:hypothetical protein L211DRAFT_765816, partial [Terfezia boudieri ATCC MYA-4762]
CGKDVACMAATGFGKSLTYQMATPMMAKRFGLIVTPLNALGEDQVFACKKFHIRACNLTAEFMQSNPEVIRDIIAGKYNLVFVAPE